MPACKTQRQGRLEICTLLHFFFLVEAGEFQPAPSNPPFVFLRSRQTRSHSAHQFALWLLILQELNDAWVFPQRWRSNTAGVGGV